MRLSSALNRFDPNPSTLTPPNDDIFWFMMPSFVVLVMRYCLIQIIWGVYYNLSEFIICSMTSLNRFVIFKWDVCKINDVFKSFSEGFLEISSHKSCRIWWWWLWMRFIYYYIDFRGASNPSLSVWNICLPFFEWD